MKTYALIIAMACGLRAQDAPPRPMPARVEPAVRQEAKPASGRIDQKKPHMRVWYWPPSPQSADFGEQPQDGSSVGSLAQGQVRASGPRIDAVNFPTNRAAVVDEELELQRLASWMAHNPGARVALEGYADTRGSKAHNLKLSRARAEAVKDFLVKHGAASNAIRVEARGAEKPLHGGNAEESLWLSRRVAVRVEAPAAVAPSSAPAEPKTAIKPMATTAAVPGEKSGEAKQGTEN